MYAVFWILIKFGFIWSYEGIFYLLKVFSKLIPLLSRLWSMCTFHLWSHLYIYTKGCKMSVLITFLIHDYIFSRSCYFDCVLKSILSCLYWYVVGSIYIFTQKVAKWVCLALFWYMITTSQDFVILIAFWKVYYHVYTGM